ncbi:MAG: kelch repeat-containing protein, partial [Planctomycetota bacterium]
MSTKTNRKKCLIVVATFLCSTCSNVKASFASGTIENIAVVVASVSLAQGPMWTQKADMPTVRISLATRAVNGKIYAIGGYAGAGAPPQTTVEEYDPATDTWTRKAPMPTALAGLSSSVVNGKIYAMGSFKGMGASLATMVMYDPVTDTW